MRSVRGVWELEDLGNERTRATFTLDSDPGRLLGLVIRGPVEAATLAIFVNARASSGDASRGRASLP